MRTACARRCPSSTSGRRPRRTWPKTSWTSGCSRPSTTSRPRPRSSRTTTPARRPRLRPRPRPPLGSPRRPWSRPAAQSRAAVGPRRSSDPAVRRRRPSRPPARPTLRRVPRGTRGLVMNGVITMIVRGIGIRTCGEQRATTTRTATKAGAVREIDTHARRPPMLLPTRTGRTGARLLRSYLDSTEVEATSVLMAYQRGSQHHCRNRATSTHQAATA